MTFYDLLNAWLLAPNACEKICRPIPGMNPQGRRVGEPFQTPVGLLLHPAAHPGCRCTDSLRAVA